MNIVLLSGGSGKRLWPLSNGVRSKQFIKLFKNENNEYESMLQRVYRQIKSVDENANIVIATSKSQVSAIHNQLEENVSICVEPCRRDTFPAIVLAAVYLHEIVKISPEESVVICPVDPYVGTSFYKKVKELSDYAEKGDYHLNLLGINPTYPSEKYGYIIPKSSNIITPVKEFKEKPNETMARKYLEKGALWNAGVFAFRLEYLLKIAHAKTDFSDFNDLYSKYESLEKTSFDYAVAEKEKSVCVMRYSGEWKDVGTWNTMSDVMSDNTKGNVILDNNCVGTNVVNELNIPILCMGCKNMIVAASVDGILVSDKEQSGYVKPYVEKISSEAMFAEKSWGIYKVIDIQPDFMTVKISLRKGTNMSYHSHKLREEIWTIASGKGRAVINGIEQILRSGDTVFIKPGVKHMICAITDLSIIEVQIGKNISAQDKEKFII